jgi:hypothetical protein
MSQKPNERCACRSGKKYKKCCGKRNSVPSPSAAQGESKTNGKNYIEAVIALSTLEPTIFEHFKKLEDENQKKFLYFAEQKAGLCKEEFKMELKVIIIRLKIIRLDKLFLKIILLKSQNFTDGDTLTEINKILNEFVTNKTPLLRYVDITKIENWIMKGMEISTNLSISKEKVKQMNGNTRHVAKLKLAALNILKMEDLTI